MKHYIFYRENNNFDDVLGDKNLKPLFKFKIRFSNYLILGNDNLSPTVQSYVMLKYGDDIKNPSDIFIDRSPVPFKDYIPNTDRPKKFK